MLLYQVFLLIVAHRSPQPHHRPPQPHINRRALLGAAALAATSPRAAEAIVNGAVVSDAEAAASGAVGLYIDLTGCKVCRKGVPATCTGTLVAPNLVLSARHCADVPASLNGSLTKLVFAAEMLEPGAPYREIEKIVSTADYGIETAGNDLLLIKMKGQAPAPWRPVELPLGLLPVQSELKEAERRQSPFVPDGIGLPDVQSYGYGQLSAEGERSADMYSAGSLRLIDLQVRTEVRPWAPGFLTTPAARGSGTCAGDSGGAALLLLRDPQGRGARQVLLGVQAAASKPCVDNQAIFVYPQTFADFIVRASRDLGSPIQQTISWRDF